LRSRHENDAQQGMTVQAVTKKFGEVLVEKWEKERRASLLEKEEGRGHKKFLGKCSGGMNEESGPNAWGLNITQSVKSVWW